MKPTLRLFPLCIAIFFSFQISAQQSITVNTAATALQMAQKLTAPGNTISNVTSTCNQTQRGIFVESNTLLPIDSGIVLTSGLATTAQLNQVYTGTASNALGTPGDAQLNGIAGAPTYDACKLEFDVYTVFDSLKFFYSFASEEWPEWACSGYNDAFAFFISGPGIPGQVNLAVLPGTSTPITINTVHFAYGGCPALNSQYMLNNMVSGNKPVYDQFTKRLKAARNVTPCNTYHLKLVIADGGDNILDSGVFIETGSFENYTVSSSSTMMIGSDPIAVEGCQDATFTFTRSTNSGSTTLNYTLGGAALNTVDYATLSGSVTFAPGVSSVNVTVDAVADGIAEGMEDVVVYLIPACSAVAYDSAIIHIYDDIDAQIAPVSPSCFGQSIILNGSTLATSVTPSWSWAPANLLINPNSQNPIANTSVTTTYTMTVTQNACTDTAQLIFVINPSPVVDAGPDVTICQGSGVQLNATSDGNTNVWSPSTGLDNPNILNPIASPAVSTTYTLTSTFTISGCSATDVITVTVQAPQTPFAGFDLNLCLNDTMQLNGTVPAGYTIYSWSPSTGLSNANILNPLAYPIVTTTYVLTASNGICTTTDQLTITVQNLQSVDAGVDLIICTGDSIQLQGVSPYLNNTWSPAGFVSQPTNLTSWATPNATMDFILTGTDGLCTDTDTMTIMVVANLTVNAGNDQTICAGDTVQLNANTNGIPTISWTPATGLSNANIANPLAYPNTTTIYTATISAGTCTATDDVTITVNPSPTVTVTPDQAICAGDNVQLQASGATTYSWTPATGLSASNIANPVASPAVTTAYVVTGTTAGCSDNATVTITVNPLPTANAGPDINICNGNSATINGSTNGTIISWSPAAGLSATNIVTPDANPTTTTSYTLTVTDANGCVSTDVVTVTVNNIVVDANPDVSLIILGESVTLFASGGVFFLWAPTTGLDNPSAGTVVATPADTTIYIVEVTDANGCIGYDTVVVNVVPDFSIFVPNAFTPNGDGTNDVLHLLPFGNFELISFQIYNRWGELVYETENINQGWDGIYKGFEQEVGSYVYYIKARSPLGKLTEFKGNVTLVR